MNLLVIGRNGQLARSLEERAAARGLAGLSFAGRPDVDLLVPGSAAQTIHSRRPDVVINAAAYTNVDGAEAEARQVMRINADAAGEIAGAAADIGCATIQLSTDYVFDGSAGSPYTEAAMPGPINRYGESKLAGERAVAEANPRHTIIRTSWLVGPYGRNFVKTMLRLAEARDEIAVVDDQRGRPTSTLDLADAILAVAERLVTGGAPPTLHVAGEGDCSWADLAAEVMRASAAAGGPSASIRPIASADYPTAAVRPAYSILSTDLFSESFSVPMQPWRPMVAALVERLRMTERQKA